MFEYYVVDAFTDQVFSGGPAGVLISDHWLPDELMQNISMENNLADTAFVVTDGSHYELRWFMPDAEINLNGHATLAAGHCILNLLHLEESEVTFSTKSGMLKVSKEDDYLVLDLPAVFNHSIPVFPELIDALGEEPSEAYFGENIFCVFDSQEKVRNLQPDFAKMKALEMGQGVFVSAQSDEPGFDIAARTFWPKMGVNEDPVCGNMHCNLTPFWCQRLGKNTIVSHQLSPRGAVVVCEDCGERVKLKGKAALFLKGELFGLDGSADR